MIQEASGTYSLQHTLARLPIPSLEHTCALYLKSILPLQTAEEHEKTKAIVKDFLASNISKSLQQHLIDLDRASPNNWLEDNFWLRKAYLEYREPLMLNSNWYILGQDDSNHPNNSAKQPLGSFSSFQIKRAAHMIRRGLEYKEITDREEIPVDMVQNKPMCMWQYGRIFSVTRVPLYGCDTLVQANPRNIRHIAVLVRNQVYTLDVYSKNSKEILSADEIESELLALVHHVNNLSHVSAAVPLLTSSHRDHWTVARNHLLTLGNRKQLTEIENSLFAVSLDDYAHGSDGASRTKTLFCGHQGLGSGQNRWYDKSITLVVESNGQCGFMGEHSPVDALIVSWIFDYMLKVPCPKTTQPGKSQGAFRHIEFITDSAVDKYIQEAQVIADKNASLSDSNVLIFKEFGTNWIKKVGKLPPDSFYQMMLQVMYYRLHGKHTATYETAATRKYYRGRTETIRSYSTESKAFVEAFDSPEISPQEKYDLLTKAVKTHRDYIKIASDGYGCDRHLLALKLLNADHVSGQTFKKEMHPLFTDPIFIESQTWRLSTSGLHSGIRLMGTGFGACCDDGYGINYMAAPDLVKFGIETKRLNKTANTDKMMETITKTLLDLKHLCEKVNQTSKL